MLIFFANYFHLPIAVSHAFQKVKAAGDKIKWLLESKEELKQLISSRNVAAGAKFVEEHGTASDKKIQSKFVATESLEKRVAQLTAISKQQNLQIFLA